MGMILTQFFLSLVNNFKNAEVHINKHTTVQLLIMLSISQTKKNTPDDLTSH